MRLTLFKKILIVMLFISTSMVVGMAWLINSSFQTGLQDYLNQGDEEKLQLVAEQVSPYYSIEYGWGKLKTESWLFILEGVFARPKKWLKEPAKARATYIDRLSKRIELIDVESTFVFKNRKLRTSLDLIKVPIQYQGEVVGWVVAKKHTSMSGALEQSFYQQQKNNFLWIVLLLALLSFVLSWILVRHLLTPLKQLQSAANSLQSGDYSTQIEVKGEDELAALSCRFNELSRSLLHQKETREQWLADISHELRTPISVLKSEIEAIQDGIRKPETKYINSLHNQVQNLSQLVNDLYELSLSDAGVQFDLSQRVSVSAILEASCSLYQLRCQEKQIQLQTFIDPKNKYCIQGDKKSLTQLFSNVLENSVRYTDGPGQLKVHLSHKGKALFICIEDSAPCVPTAALPKLFDRLFRVDESRSRLSGGSGLGLSICKNIVHAHQGEMTADYSKLGGLAITITFPLSSIQDQ